MIRLEIKKDDGSLYWKENFSSLEECQLWLEAEMQKPYWDLSFKKEIIDYRFELAEQTRVSSEALQNRISKKSQIKQDLQESSNRVRGLPEINEVIEKLIEFVK